MGMVMSEINCPRCNYEGCTEDYYYKTDEVYIFCSECGYLYESSIKRDENGNIVTTDGTKNYKLDNIEYNEKIINGYGSYKLYDNDGLRTVGILEDEEDIDELKRNLKSKQKEHKFTKLEINIYNEGDIIKKVAWKRKKSKNINPILDPYGEEDWND